MSPTGSRPLTLADWAIQFARGDHRPARKADYLAPLQKLHRVCRDGSAERVSAAVFLLGTELQKLPGIAAPAAAAEAVLAADAREGSRCGAIADAIRSEAAGRFSGSRSLYSGRLRFSPPLTADIALAALTDSLFPGRVHAVYALTAFSCQQAIFMGPKLGRRYGNASLGAFVELTSGRGVGHGKYDANRVNLARITPLGRIGGQPCR